MGLIMKWYARFCAWRERMHIARLRALAEVKPSFQWLICECGTDAKERSPMLALDEIRDWFREFYPNRRVAYIDETNKILFYE